MRALKFDLDGMIAAAEPNAQGEVSLRGRFADPRFERAYSGWYWEIIPADSKNERRQISRSLFDHTIKSRISGRARKGHYLGPWRRAGSAGRPVCLAEDRISHYRDGQAQ